MVLLEFSMSPLGKGDSVSDYVARSLQIIDESGLAYELHAMGTIIEGEVEGGGGGTITYVLTPDGNSTRFERTFVYTMPNRLLAFLDRLFIRRLMDASSDRALRQLRQVLAAG